MSGMTDAVPCAVIVDSRNLRGQSAKMFGWGRMPCVSGVREAMALYGLDATEIYFGAATRSASSSASSRMATSLEQNWKYRQQLIEDGAEVLDGYLVERGRPSRVEEKQVDVLCAVKACDVADRIATNLSSAKCIVVLSEDMDLMPAYDFARQRGVPAYAAAFDTVHQRADQREWLLLTERAMKHLVQPLGRYFGSALRRKLADIVTQDGGRQAFAWTVQAPSGQPNQYLMRNGLGAPGLWDAGRQVPIRTRVDLHAVGVTIFPTQGGRFPHLVLSECALSGRMPDIEMAEVLYWQSPTSVKVTLPDGTASLRVTPGSLLPGQRVAVLRRAAGPDRATYLIGPASTAAAVPGWTPVDPLATAMITGDARGAWYPAALTTSGDEILVHAAHLSHVTLGTKVLVFVSGVASNQARPQAMPVSCCLPTVKTTSM